MTGRMGRTGNHKEGEMGFEIYSRKIGKKLTFTVPGGSYIFVDLNGKPGTLGMQICRGGDIVGDTLAYSGSDDADFEKICRNWYRAYLKKHGSEAAFFAEADRWARAGEI